MKLITKFFLILAVSTTFSFALTPFSLEGVKEVNVRILNKDKTFPKELLKKMQTETIKKLKSAGLQTTTDQFSNFLIKIDTDKIDEQYVVNINLMLIEMISPQRNQKLVNIGITFQISDFFIADDLEDEVYSSVVEYLVPTFVEQYKEEN